MNGTIREVKVWNRILNKQEIEELFRKYNPPRKNISEILNMKDEETKEKINRWNKVKQEQFNKKIGLNMYDWIILYAILIAILSMFIFKIFIWWSTMITKDQIKKELNIDITRNIGEDQIKFTGKFNIEADIVFTEKQLGKYKIDLTDKNIIASDDNMNKLFSDVQDLIATHIHKAIS